MKKLLIALSILVSSTIHAQIGTPPNKGSESADITISGMYGNNKIEMTSCGYVAGVICSLKYKNLEFINGRLNVDGSPVDHGRQMQSAVSYNKLGEAYNPTQAGSSFFNDGFYPQPTQTSQMLGRWWADNHVGVRVKMGFWNTVWDKYDPYKYYKTSNTEVFTQVTIGVSGFQNVILYKATFAVPAVDLIPLTFGQFEVTTAYMQTYFNTFYILNDNGNISPIADIQKEQNKPVIFSTSDGQYAMGIYSPEAPQPEYKEAGYGIWRHPTCTKMNYVVRVNNLVQGQSYKYRAYYVVGTLSEVQNTMNALRRTNLPTLEQI